MNGGPAVLLADEWDYPLDLSSGIPAKQKLFLLHLSSPLKSDFKSDLQLFFRFTKFDAVFSNLLFCFCFWRARDLLSFGVARYKFCGKIKTEFLRILGL